MAHIRNGVLVDLPPLSVTDAGLYFLEELGYEGTAAVDEDISAPPKLSREFTTLAATQLPGPNDTRAPGLVAVMQYLESCLSTSALHGMVYGPKAGRTKRWNVDAATIDGANPAHRRAATAIMVIAATSEYAEEFHDLLADYIGAIAPARAMQTIDEEG